jgi:hypothetical protein
MMNRLLVTFLALAASCPAAEAPSKDMRIALRYGFGDVLLIGGKIGGAGTAGLSQMVYRIELMPALRVFVITPEFLAKIAPPPEPATDWKPGDRWQLYTGSGAPVTVTIDRLLLFEMVHNYSVGALAHIVDADAANRVAGLRATAYIAAPGKGLDRVSQVPLLPEKNSGFLADEDSGRVLPALIAQARKTVQNKDWKTEDLDEGFKKRVQEMNQTFLESLSTDDKFPTDMQILRWPLPDKPLLFVQPSWSKSNSQLFAADVVMERGSLKILSFDTARAEFLRTEFGQTPVCIPGTGQCQQVTMDAANHFLNAWKIGNRYYVLTLFRSAFGVDFTVALQELDAESGLSPTTLSFHATED